MSLGEGLSPEFPSLDNLTVPHNPMEALVQRERKERKWAFGALREQITRLELLGKDDASRQSFHRTYINDGIVRSVLFTAAQYERIGRTHRIIVNDEQTLNDGGRELRMAEYIVSGSSDLISYTWSFMRRGKAEISWGEPHTLDAPILRQRDTTVEVVTGTGYELFLPECEGHDFVEVMERREAATDLSMLLARLNEVTRQDGMYLSQ